MELPEGLSVSQFKEILNERFPDLAPLANALAVAVDGVLVAPEAALPVCKEIALLPPVSGG